MTAPAGQTNYCVITASGFFGLGSGAYGRCSITTGTTEDQNALILMNNRAAAFAYMQFAGTRGFSLGAGITETYNLACDSSLDTGNNINDTFMTAVCSPKRY